MTPAGWEADGEGADEGTKVKRRGEEGERKKRRGVSRNVVEKRRKERETRVKLNYRVETGPRGGGEGEERERKKEKGERK